MRSFLKSLRKLLEIVLFGTIALFLVSFPIVCALAAHFIANHLGHPHPDSWALGVGLLSLLILPFGIAGNALWSSLGHARKREKLQSNPPAPAQTSSSPFDAKDVVAVWQTSLEVQQHFNDLELQIRNFAITLLVAVMGGTAFTLKEH